MEDPEEITALLAVGDQYFEQKVNEKDVKWMKSFFLFAPPPYTRKSNIIASDQKQMIKEKIFVTNEHLLVQFHYSSVPVKDDCGRV